MNGSQDAFGDGDEHRRKAYFEWLATTPPYSKCPEYWIDKALKDSSESIRAWAAAKLQNYPTLSDRVHWASGSLDDSSPAVQLAATDSLLAIVAHSPDHAESAHARRILEERGHAQREIIEVQNRAIAELNDQAARLADRVRFLQGALGRSHARQHFLEDLYNVWTMAAAKGIVPAQLRSDSDCFCEDELTCGVAAKQLAAIAQVVRKGDRRCIRSLMAVAFNEEYDDAVRLAAAEAFRHIDP
jgi:hypothetical protein